MAVVAALVEGNSIRATVRMTGVAKNTVVKLLCDLGRACSDYQDKTFVNLKCERIQCDEIWSFVGAKEKNCSAEMKAKGAGDVWEWGGAVGGRLPWRRCCRRAALASTGP